MTEKTETRKAIRAWGRWRLQPLTKCALCRKTLRPGDAVRQLAGGGVCCAEHYNDSPACAG